MSLRARILLTIGAMTTVLMIAALFAQYISAVYLFRLHGQAPSVSPKPSVRVTGRWFDDYFLVESLDGETIAIREPRYKRGNYSYLILGARLIRDNC